MVGTSYVHKLSFNFRGEGSHKDEIFMKNILNTQYTYTSKQYCYLLLYLHMEKEHYNSMLLYIGRLYTIHKQIYRNCVNNSKPLNHYNHNITEIIEEFFFCTVYTNVSLLFVQSIRRKNENISHRYYLTYTLQQQSIHRQTK